LKKSVEVNNTRCNLLNRGLIAINKSHEVGHTYPMIPWKEQYEAYLGEDEELEKEKPQFMEACNRVYGTALVSRIPNKEEKSEQKTEK